MAFVYLWSLFSRPFQLITTYFFYYIAYLCEFQLEEVMEKETYKAAKDLLAKYDPNSEVVKVTGKCFIMVLR